MKQLCSEITDDSCVQFLVRQLLLREVAERYFGCVVSLTDGANHFLFFIMLNLRVNVNPRDFPAVKKRCLLKKGNYTYFGQFYIL